MFTSLLPVLALPLVLATPPPTDTCALVSRFALNSYIGNPAACDSCADARAVRWSNCARRSAQELVRDKTGVGPELIELETTLDQMVDVVAALGAIQSGGHDMTHEVVRFRARVTSAMLDVAKIHASGESLDLPPRLQGDMDRIRKNTLDRIEAPHPTDFLLASNPKEAQDQWLKHATDYGPLFQRVARDYDKPTHVVVHLLEELNRRMLASDDEMRRAASADSLRRASAR